MKPSRRTWAAVGVIGGAIALGVVVGVVQRFAAREHAREAGGRSVRDVYGRAGGDDRLVEGAHRSTMYQLADWTLWADKVLTF